MVASLTWWVLNVALPALVLELIPRVTFDPQLWFLVASMWLTFAGAWLLFGVLGARLGWSRQRIGALILVCGLGNTGFMGYPLLQALRGREGLALAIVALLSGIWGTDPKIYPVPSWMNATSSVAGASIPHGRVVTVLVGLAVLGLFVLFLRRTRYGLIVRAGVENRAMVTALGIDVRRAFKLVFTLGGAAAGLAGALAGVYFGSVTPGLGSSLLIYAFIVVVIGGLGSVPGSALAAAVVGLVQQFANYYTASGIGDLSVVLLLAVVLLLRPQGLLGRAM